jgi:hypothetical protein
LVDLDHWFYAMRYWDETLIHYDFWLQLLYCGIMGLVVTAFAARWHLLNLPSLAREAPASLTTRRVLPSIQREKALSPGTPTIKAQDRTTLIEQQKRNLARST